MNYIGVNEFKYDNRGRLIRFGTTVLEYDNYGNRTKKNEYEVYTWERGNKLKRITKYPHTEIEYTYDYTGKRSAKSISVGGVQEEYIQYHYDGNNLVGEDRTGGIKLRYFYDAQGICGFRYINGNTIKDIIYVKNIFGDVEFLLDSSGNVLAQYTYDAWGKCSLVSDTDGVGELNPIRYRGYYYDTESKLYYLLTRYYDPETATFITPDSVKYLEPWELSGIDLYAYCYHNPIMYYDPTGYFAVTTFLISLAIGTLISWGLSEIFGSQIAGGISSTVSGGAAIYTGIGLLSFGPVGWIVGGALILIGAGTMAFGVNEIVAGATGTNYIQSWTGMSDGLYNGLYIGLNIASDVGTIAGNIYMKYANVTGNKAGIKGKSFSRYSTIDDAGVKQYRFFDSKGNAWFDKDFRHGGANLKFPHYHGWINGIRLGGHWSFWDLIKWLF